MINKLVIFLISLLFLYNNVQANSFIFETKNIEIIKDENKILAGKGKVISFDKDLEINADNFEYLKDQNILSSSGNGKATIKSKNLVIQFNEAVFDQNNLIVNAKGNIKINHINKKFFITTENILYDQLNDLIKSTTKTTIKDSFENTYIVDNFIFEIDKNLLKVVNLLSKDKNNNIIETELAYINTKSGKLFGKDVNMNFNNSSFNRDNEPRLKAISIVKDEEITELTKGVFTTCKKRDGCPPWEISAEKISHNKQNKMINYENALLKVYDVPVMYFPKFFHPDPTVKRQSGFLIPTIKNSTNSSNFLNTPYFFAIAENKDATFSPRFYTEEKILIQTEYRQANKNSNHITDFSFFNERGNSSKNHIFYEYDKDFSGKIFKNKEISFKVQQTNNDTYLKSDKIDNNITDDYNILENSLGLDIYSNDLSISVNANVYEDLNKTKSDRYEYILPRVDIVKNINNLTTLNGNLTFKSQALVRNYNTNIYERTNTNDLLFKSFPKISFGGFYNNYEFLIKNSNTKNKNSLYKNKENLNLSGIFQFNSSLPLIKESENYQKTKI